MPHNPFILSEGVQRFAIERRLHEAIIGLSGEATDIAIYVDTLAAVEVAARARTRALGQDIPNFNDYILAAATWCRIPLPFKPPEVAEYAHTVANAYLNERKREMIQEALGSRFLSASFDELNSMPSAVDFEHFKQYFLNFDRLK
jgi:hypothetical protein